MKDSPTSKPKLLEQFDNAAAFALFEEWFAKNYPGPNTIISRPHWHAPKIWRQMLFALGMNERAAAETPAVQVRLSGHCAACDKGWAVSADPRTDVLVTAFHCPCGHVTDMAGLPSKTDVPTHSPLNCAHERRSSTLMGGKGAVNTVSCLDCGASWKV